MSRLLTTGVLNQRFIPISGKCAYFNGTTSYAYTSPENFNMPSGTIECWIKKPFNIVGGAYICGGAFGHGAIEYRGDRTSIRFRLRNISTSYYLEFYPYFIMSPGVWYHVAGTWGTGGRHIYINGSLVNSSVDEYSVVGSNYFAIGCAGPDSYTYTNIYISEVRLWNIKRTQAEIISTLRTRITSAQTGLTRCYSLNNTFSDTTGQKAALNNSQVTFEDIN
jgi:hypothetical protein